MGNAPLMTACLDGGEKTKEGALSNESQFYHGNSQVCSTAATSVSSRSSNFANTNDRHNTPSPSPRPKRRPSSKKVDEIVKSAMHRLLKALRAFSFPSLPEEPPTASSSSSATHFRGGVLLHGCSTPTEHYAKIKAAIDMVRGLRGEEGLRALGLEYRMLPCANHALTERILDSKGADDDDDEDDDGGDGDVRQDNQVNRALHIRGADEVVFDPETKEELVQLNDASTLRLVSTEPLSDNPYMFSIQPCAYTESIRSVCTDQFDIDDVLNEPESDFATDSGPKCMLCMRRLYHKATNTLITLENRKSFIADGDMYESIARLCQEYALDAMCQEAMLEWLTVQVAEPSGSDDGQLIQVLVNANHPCLCRQAERNLLNENDVDRPSLLIATGRGKVRAGIFSREHLIGSGMELASALPTVHEAMRRKMNIVIVDHNICGEVLGFVNFEKTMNCIFERLATSVCDDGQEKRASQHDFFILAHSASGGHLCRYLLERHGPYLQRIRAIAFTDSTHNIQWSKKQGMPELTDLLESNKCVYFRSSKAREQEDNSLWYLHRSGEPIQTDEFWQHRFGKINTFWAGTNEHSLTNWYAHSKIWQHFDEFLDEAYVS